MRHSSLAALLLLTATTACGSGFDPKSAADGTRAATAPPEHSAGSPKPPAAPGCAPTEPCAEPFALAEVAFEVDLFEKRPGVALPPDARLEIGTAYGSVGQGPGAVSLAAHFASVTYASGIDGFDRDVAAPLRAAITMPPRTWLAFEGKPNPRTRAMEYRSVVVRQPLVITTADVASARAAERASTRIDLGAAPAKTPAAPAAYAVEVTLADAPAARLAAWTEKHPEHPLASLVHGRVVEQGRTVDRSKQLWIELPWLAPEDTRAGAEKLAREITARSP